MQSGLSARAAGSGGIVAAAIRAVPVLVLALGMVPSAGPARAEMAPNAVIDLTYDSVMDMVRPEVRPGIMVHHDLHIKLFRGEALGEKRDRSAGRYSDRNAMVQVLGSSGDEGAYASWRVMPDGSLMRIQRDPQSTRKMTVTLTGNTCHLDVEDKLLPGFHEYAFRRISTRALGYFSTYRVTTTSCTIH